MPNRPSRAATLAVALLCTSGCGAGSARDVPEPRLLDVPAGPGAAQPFVASAAGSLLLSWTEPTAAGHALRFSSWDGTRWSEPGTAAEGADWFVNWADFPSVIDAGDVLVAHWLQRSGPGRYSYDVMLTRSADGGATWSPPTRPHGDGTQTEHGFVSLFPLDGDVGIVWLDGRQYAGHDDPHGHGDAGSEMQVRFTALSPGGELQPETLLDARACDCCQTAVARTRRGPVVAYRDRSAAEIRDISITRLVDDAWTAPVPLHEDGWEISGCPVNGPAADADGDVVVVAWFTAPAEQPRVRVSFSDDAGATFGEPVDVSDGAPLGRVDVLLLDPGRAFVVWLENVGEGAELRGRIVGRSGRGGPARTIAATSAQRASGFPRMARRGSEVLLAWTEVGASSHVRAAVLRFDAR